jgi:isoleucyl-tRNA synthetase
MSKKHGRENDSVEVTDKPEKSDVAKREEAVLAFWREHSIFQKSVETPAGSAPVGDFVFYDGPPFATGVPHYGHLLASTIKDAVPRFWTMQGYRVRRTWGWDCHGLPLENLIEKELGLATKRDIEKFGIQNFNEKARSAVMRYADEWKQIIPRFGRFVDMENDYKTMDSTYTESVWWVFQSLYEKGLVYEGFKGMHLCPRCGTTLSNFEVNQGYKDIKDIAVTVKLPLLDDQGEPTNTSLLVWTTTPWTLPGNLAAAVHQDYEYVKAKVVTEDEKDTNIETLKVETVILAKQILHGYPKHVSETGTETYAFTHDTFLYPYETIKGSELLGTRYKPPFPYLHAQEMGGKENAWTIYHADYVELGEEGTGAVHLAPAYGEDDLNLAQKHGVPVMHHVNENGQFKDFVTEFAGQLVKPKDDDDAEVTHLDADIMVVRALQERGTLFRKENITHSYPHCWRCDTPLLNYATTSWFVAVTAFKDTLVSENEHIHWVPEYVGDNRFGKWLEGARDWAISRQRYWGAPLPIWRNPETGEVVIIGSLKEMQKHIPSSDNRYIVMRHTEAESNTTGEINANPDRPNPLTDRGKEQAAAVAAELAEHGVDLIIHSGMERTEQTAQIVAQHIGLPEDAVISDTRIAELYAGATLEGKQWSEYAALYANEYARFTATVSDAENRLDVQRRVGSALYEWDEQYAEKRILVVSHASTSFALECAASGLSVDEAVEKKAAEGFLQNGAWKEVSFTPLPHNDDYVLDLHRPYIDRVPLYQDGTKLERVPEVFDCWFESGSMPYGQHHYPFAEDDTTFLREHYPANFIAEGLDQTRGWFYSLIVLGVALFGRSPFQNVIVNGLTLAEDGKKMSKSQQNYPDPMRLADKFGVDTIRYYLLSSPIMRAEDLHFSEKEVQELQRKNIGRLHNVLCLYSLYTQNVAAHTESTNALDRWIIARMAELIREATEGYTNYELDRANRPITDFIDDLSVWYVRRSRDRFKGGDRIDTQHALATLRYILCDLAKVMAPAMPFYAEHLYLAVRSNDMPESVHLCTWPTAPEVVPGVIEEMAEVRDFIRRALEQRTHAGIKVRQPLPAVTLRRNEPFADGYLRLIKDELNVKSVQYDSSIREPVVLDTAITPALAQEGEVREFTRAVQGARKQASLRPDDVIVLYVDQVTEELIHGFTAEVLGTTGASEYTVSDTPRDSSSWNEVAIGDKKYRFSIELLV